MPTAHSIYYWIWVVVALYNSDFILRLSSLCFTYILVVGLSRPKKKNPQSCPFLFWKTIWLKNSGQQALMSTEHFLLFSQQFSNYMTMQQSGTSTNILTPMMKVLTLQYLMCLFLALITEMGHDLPESLKRVPAGSEQFHPLGHDTVQSGRQVPSFWINILPPSSQ